MKTSRCTMLTKDRFQNVAFSTRNSRQAIISGHVSCLFAPSQKVFHLAGARAGIQEPDQI